MAPGETENNAYANFWGDKQRTFGMLWYFLEWSIFLLPKQPRFESIIPSIKYIIESMVYCSHIPHMVSASWL